MSTTPQLRLAIYEQALEDWKTDSFRTSLGFCHYFSSARINITWLPELYNQVPETRWEVALTGIEYWFEVGTPNGRYLRRIALIAAIEEVKTILSL